MLLFVVLSAVPLLRVPPSVMMNILQVQVELGNLLCTEPDLATLLTFCNLVTFGDLVLLLRNKLLIVQLPDVTTPLPVGD